MAQTPNPIRSIIHTRYPHLGRVTEVTPVNAGNISRTYKVATDAPRSYIVKAKPSNRFDLQATARMHHYMAFVKAHDLSVPGIVAAADGDSVVQDGTTLYEVQEYVDHEGNLDDCEYADVSWQVFALLGRLHRISQTYPHAFPRAAYLGDSTLPIGLFARHFGGALEHAIPRGSASAAAEATAGRELLDYLQTFDRILRGIREETVRKVGTLDQVINHNDIYGNNLLFRGGRLVALIDFDFCQTDVYYLDLVEALHYSVLLERSEKRYFGLPVDGQLRVRNGTDDLRAYFAENAAFAYDGALLVQLLIAKVISLALFPLCEFYPQVDERLEMYRRVRRAVERLQDLGTFER